MARQCRLAVYRLAVYQRAVYVLYSPCSLFNGQTLWKLERTLRAHCLCRLFVSSCGVSIFVQYSLVVPSSAPHAQRCAAPGWASRCAACTVCMYSMCMLTGERCIATQGSPVPGTLPVAGFPVNLCSAMPRLVHPTLFCPIIIALSYSSTFFTQRRANHSNHAPNDNLAPFSATNLIYSMPSSHASQARPMRRCMSKTCATPAFVTIFISMCIITGPRRRRAFVAPCHRSPCSCPRRLIASPSRTTSVPSCCPPRCFNRSTPRNLSQHRVFAWPALPLLSQSPRQYPPIRSTPLLC